MCLDADQDAFAVLVSTVARIHTQELVRIARDEGLTTEDALDAVQEAFHTFVRMPQARSLLEDVGEARTLLRVLVRNVARNLRRRHHRALPHAAFDEADGMASDTPSADMLLERAEHQIQLAGCIGRLTDIQRSIIKLRVLEELSGADVARTLHLTTGHVAVLLHRAKKDLMRCMEGESRAT